MEDNILSNIFCTDFLHYFVRDIFLSLDPSSLHACRQVSKDWNIFIQNEVWGKPQGRKEMKKKLLCRFKMGTPKVSKINLGPEFFCCQMDEKSLVIASIGGIIKIVNHESIKGYYGGTVKTIKCSDASVNIDMNDQLIVAGSTGGKMMVWSRNSLDGNHIYESNPPASQSQGFISGIKIVGNLIITATSDRVITTHNYVDGNVVQKNVVGLAIGSINHIDADEEHIVFATANGFRMADMDEDGTLSLTETDMDPSKSIHHCALFYPYATYSPSYGGFKLVNVATGKLLRHLHDGVTIGVVAINKRMLAVQDSSKNWDIFIYDQKQLVDSKIRDKDLWSRRIQIDDRLHGNFFRNFSYFLDINETSIVHYSKKESRIVIHDFWMGEVSPEVNVEEKKTDVQDNPREISPSLPGSSHSAGQVKHVYLSLVL